MMVHKNNTVEDEGNGKWQYRNKTEEDEGNDEWQYRNDNSGGKRKW